MAESTLVFNVLSFGAKPNGVIDSTQAFLDVWTAACASSDSTTIRVPKGRYLLHNAMVFNGDNCKSTDITFRIDGTLIASSDYRILGQANNWLSFEGVTGVSIIRSALDLTLKVPPCGHASLEALIAPMEEPRLGVNRAAGAVCGGRSRVEKIWRVEREKERASGASGLGFRREYAEFILYPNS
ncbi:unnamed protein product [Prunus armeniaca]